MALCSNLGDFARLADRGVAVCCVLCVVLCVGCVSVCLCSASSPLSAASLRFCLAPLPFAAAPSPRRICSCAVRFPLSHSNLTAHHKWQPRRHRSQQGRCQAQIYVRAAQRTSRERRHSYAFASLRISLMGVCVAVLAVVVLCVSGGDDPEQVALETQIAEMDTAQLNGR